MRHPGPGEAGSVGAGSGPLRALRGQRERGANAHYISRAHGGLGIPENIVTLCTGFGPGNCHDRYDNGTREEREAMGRRIRAYLQSQYPDWEESRLLYKKGDSDG